jgi:hypothetical protein
MAYLLNSMNNLQIVRMLNTTIYRHLPTTHKNVTFKSLIRRLINFIDGRRMRRYVILRINQALHIQDNYEDVEEEDAARLEEAEDPVHDKMCRIYDEFSDEGQRWIDRFCSIVDEATKEQQFVMLNLLRILNLGPEPDEGLQQAMDRINNINNRQV